MSNAAAVTKPAAEPVSTPGNMQDVRDLQQMLANLQLAHEASIDQVSRLEAEKTDLASKVEGLEGENKDLTATKNAEARRADSLEEKVNSERRFRIESACDLADVWSDIKRGRTADALHRLEKILGERDSAWRTLAA